MAAHYLTEEDAAYDWNRRDDEKNYEKSRLVNRKENKMNDLISRKAAINGKISIQRANGVEIYSDEAVPVEYLKNLPSAQPESQWILCSERMPEEHKWLGTERFGTTISDEVYVTFENEKGERFCKHLSFQNGGLSFYDNAYIETWCKPIAWMPLPKPFEGGIK